MAGDDEKRDEKGAVARIAPIVALVAAVLSIVTGVIALWPRGDEPAPSAKGDILTLEPAPPATLSEVAGELQKDKRCPGEDPRRESVGLPVATAGVVLAAAESDRGAQSRPRLDEPPPRILRVLPLPPTAEEAQDPDTPDVEELADRAQTTPERVEDLLYNAPPGPKEDISRAQVRTILNETRLVPARRPRAPGPRTGPSGPSGPGGPTGPGGAGQGPSGPGGPPSYEGASADLAQAPPGQGGALEPLGWVIDATTLLEGLDGKCAYMQWSVYNDRTGKRLRRSWLVDRRGARFLARRSPDKRSGRFWIPIPKAKGRYRVEAALFDTESTRLDVDRVKGLE